MGRELVREAEVGAAVTHQTERRLVLAVRVLAAAVLHVHHEGALVRQAKGGAGIAGVAVDRVADAAGLPADEGTKATRARTHTATANRRTNYSRHYSRTTSERVAAHASVAKSDACRFLTTHDLARKGAR